MNTFCYAHDEEGKAREKHKPVPGKCGNQEIITCAWCGKTLQNVRSKLEKFNDIQGNRVDFNGNYY